MKNVSQKVALCGMLTALAMIFSYVEAILPIQIGIPGVKLGLANLVVLMGFEFLKPREVLAVSLARILLVGFLFGTGSTIIYSLAGGILSFLVMLAIHKVGSFSVIGMSAAGGVSHNIGQLIAACIMVRSLSLVWYLPVLLIAGLVTGILMGFLETRVFKALGKVILPMKKAENNEAGTGKRKDASCRAQEEA